jgi:glutamate-ammonia-ligase adenylyltransferase
VITEEERDALSRAYIFLRDVENKLQMVNDAQTHSIPTDAGELQACARMLGYQAAEQFLSDYRFHTAEVNRIFESVFNSQELQRFAQARQENTKQAK